MKFLSAVVLAACCCLAAAAATPPPRYAYGGATFTSFVADSCRQSGALAPADFYRWATSAFERTAAAGDERDLTRALRDRARAVAAQAEPRNRAYCEAQAAAWTHRIIKTMIPRFSLQRGFEFTNVVEHGERQCFLQSVLGAALLQAMGIDAGVVMVNSNPKGKTSNNGHAVVLVRLADGRDLEMDASEPEPFARHQGLFVSDGARHYLYVMPQYLPNSEMITAYSKAGSRASVLPARLATMDIAFLRSQFEYYRGEQATCGLLAKSPTIDGLKHEEQHLEMSVSYCPLNPLAVYMLGRTHLKLGEIRTARRELTKAERLYRDAGWVPQGAADALRQARNA